MFCFWCEVLLETSYNGNVGELRAGDGSQEALAITESSASFSLSDSTTDRARNRRADDELDITRRLCIEPDADVLTRAGVRATDELEGNASMSVSCQASLTLTRHLRRVLSSDSTSRSTFIKGHFLSNSEFLVGSNKHKFHHIPVLSLFLGHRGVSENKSIV